MGRAFILTHLRRLFQGVRVSVVTSRVVDPRSDCRRDLRVLAFRTRVPAQARRLLVVRRADRQTPRAQLPHGAAPLNPEPLIGTCSWCGYLNFCERAEYRRVPLLICAECRVEQEAILRPALPFQDPPRPMLPIAPLPKPKPAQRETGRVACQRRYA